MMWNYNKIKKIPFGDLITILGSILVLVGLFLPWDSNPPPQHIGSNVVNLGRWFVWLYIIMFLGLLFKRARAVTGVFSIIVLFMQLPGLITSSIETPSYGFFLCFGGSFVYLGGCILPLECGRVMPPIAQKRRKIIAFICTAVLLPMVVFYMTFDFIWRSTNMEIPHGYEENANLILNFSLLFGIILVFFLAKIFAKGWKIKSSALFDYMVGVSLAFLIWGISLLVLLCLWISINAVVLNGHTYVSPTYLPLNAYILIANLILWGVFVLTISSHSEQNPQT